MPAFLAIALLSSEVKFLALACPPLRPMAAAELLRLSFIARKSRFRIRLALLGCMVEVSLSLAIARL